MATFRTYAEVVRPDHPLMKNKARTTSWSPSRYRSAEIEQAMRAEPDVVLGDVLRRTGGAYETTTRLMPKFREDIREIAELTADDELRRIAELAEVLVSLEHLRDMDPQTRILVGYRLDVTPAESPRLRRRLALPPDPRITLHFDEVVFGDTSQRFWSAMRWDTPRPENRRSFHSAASLRTWPTHSRGVWVRGGDWAAPKLRSRRRAQFRSW